MTNQVRRIDFSDVALYAVTPDWADGSRILKQVEGILAGGADAIQLRSRSFSDRELMNLGKQVKDLCHKAGALFILNNRVDVALAIDADGVHIGHEDLPVAFAREMIGHRKILGVSTHSMPEAIEAQKAGADYVSCGPLWATPTKPSYKPVGLGLIGLYNAALRVPFVAIGGVDEKNIDEVVKAGAKTVAVVRALFDSQDPKSLAEKFKTKISVNRKQPVKIS